MNHLLNSRPGSEKIDSFWREIRNNSNEVEDFIFHYLRECPLGYDHQNMAMMAILVFHCRDATRLYRYRMLRTGF